MMVDLPAFGMKIDSLSMERLDGETILIDFESGEYFSFKGTSADLVWLVQNEIPYESWENALSEAFPGLSLTSEIWQEISEFLYAMERAGILIRVDTVSGTMSELPQDYERITWQAPEVMINSDLVDLLVIDPIHDASEDGWPDRKA
jgi:hypothetical protein